MIIEFAGLPGSGKSTVETLLMTALKEKDYLVCNRHELRRKPSLSSGAMKALDSLLVGKLITLLHYLILTGKTLYANPEYLIDLMALKTHTTRTTARVYDDYAIIEHWFLGQDEKNVLNQFHFQFYILE